MENIEISLAGGGTVENARVVVPEAIDQYPEVKTFGPTIPAWGIWARHVKRLKLKEIRFTLASPDLRPAFIAEDAQDIELTGWKLPAVAEAATILRLEGVQGAKIDDFTVTGGKARLLKIEGKGNKDIKSGKVKYATSVTVPVAKRQVLAIRG
ncbi:hypothetical protein [Paraflavitalea speifideaquila]|uniref:hypothetical protein n=1 Tax=Paraflavitalea speifideaquila TaxID=3076558 RepID=UPI0028EC3897|nr:hypothetical protein [Paraflavitalea speifideiaquila]